MLEHDTLRKQGSGLPMPWRLLMALAAGLVLGGLGIILISQISWSIPGLCLTSPLLTLLGVLGRLAVGARTNHPFQSGWSLGGLAWFGIWLAVLLWVVLTPITENYCFPDPCPPTIQSFWDDDYALVYLVFFGLYLLWGLLVVLGGVAVTQSVLKNKRPSASAPAAFR